MVDWKAIAEELADSLKQCADQFQFYGSEHRSAGKIEKAETNERFSCLARATLAKFQAMKDADHDQ